MENNENTTIHPAQIVTPKNKGGDQAALVILEILCAVIAVIAAVVFGTYYLVMALASAPAWALAMFFVYMMFKR